MKVETTGGSGTGWVYEEGWLVTAAHVIKGYRTVTVHYQDSEGQEKSAMVTVLGRDRLHDVAAIELKDIDLPPIPGRRDVEAKDGGEAVMTVGYSSDPPIGWPSIRVGILTTVSELPWLENLKAIETDAAFDPGDSGGPILDLNGNVIGIAQATVIRSGSQQIQGRQLAVGIREVEAVWEQLKRNERLNQGSDYWIYRRSEGPDE